MNPLPIDPAHEAPLYRKVRNELTDSIARGVWKPGEAIPSEGNLAAQFGDDSKMTWNLYPPMLRSMGLGRKLRFGSWSVPVMRHCTATYSPSAFYRSLTANRRPRKTKSAPLVRER